MENKGYLGITGDGTLVTLFCSLNMAAPGKKIFILEIFHKRFIILWIIWTYNLILLFWSLFLIVLFLALLRCTPHPISGANFILYRWVRPTKKMGLLSMTFNSSGDLESVEYPFIAITSRFTLTWSGSTCWDPIYGSNMYIQKSFIFNRTVGKNNSYKKTTQKM